MAHIELRAILSVDSELESRVSAHYALSSNIRREASPDWDRPEIPTHLPTGEEVVVLRPVKRG